jgi:hypothetical protein
VVPVDDPPLGVLPLGVVPVEGMLPVLGVLPVPDGSCGLVEGVVGQPR